MPFSVKAIWVDGGSEFEVVFEEECQKQLRSEKTSPPAKSTAGSALTQAPDKKRRKK